MGSLNITDEVVPHVGRGRGVLRGAAKNPVRRGISNVIPTDPHFGGIGAVRCLDARGRRRLAVIRPARRGGRKNKEQEG